MRVREIAACVVLVVVSATACTVAPTDYTPRGEECVAASASCLMPFPSDEWLVPDASTATGVRVVPPVELVPKPLQDQLGPGASIADAYADADGFSAVGPIFLQFPDGIDPSSVPADGGEVVALYNERTHERIAIRTLVSSYGVDEYGQRGALEIWPRTVFPYGERIVAVVNDGVRTPFGKSVRKARNLFLDASSTDAKRASVGRLLDHVSGAAPGQPLDKVIGATSFVVASKQSMNHRMDEMAAQIRARDHQIRVNSVAPSLFGGSIMVMGQVLATDFRTHEGYIPRAGELVGRDVWIDFLLVLPDHAPAGMKKSPVVVYGHGLTILKESMLVTAGINAEKGIATIGVDVPHHGSRSAQDGWLLDRTSPAFLGQIAAIPAQGALDELSLLMAIQQHLDTLDVMPASIFGSGDGHPDLDTTKVMYQGTSMGGYLGTMFVAMAPELVGAFLQVPGAGVIDTLFHSALWPLFAPVVPGGAKVGDALALIGGAQSLVDIGDSTHFIDRIKSAGTPFTMAYGVDDAIVPVFAAERIINMLDLSLVGPQQDPVWRSPGQRGTPRSGSGAFQIDTTPLAPLGPFAGLAAHVSFQLDDAQQALRSWLDDRMVALR